MCEESLCEKIVPLISKKRRSDEDNDALSGLTKKFPKVIKSFSHNDLYKITEYYKPYLAYVIDYDITSILQNLATKNILTNDEAKRVKEKEECEGRAGVESFISDIMNMDRGMLVNLWEALAEERVRFPSPNLTRILKEVTEGGPNILLDIQASLQPPPIKANIKDLYETHRGDVSESTRTLEDQASPDDPNTRDVGFETRYTDLMIIGQYKRTYDERHHELVKMGKTHAELMEDWTKEKCELIWMEQLFRRSPGNQTAPCTVVVSGVAGMGKSTMVQKIMFDWARGTQYQRFSFVFLFKFRELNLLDTETEPQMPLTRLIVRHYKYLSDPRLREILQKPESLLFIFDGLDEYKHKLDFKQRRFCTNPNDFFPVHNLVTSLFNQTLLKGCTVLITTRPTALETLDMERVDRFLEILGFFPEQRLMYFKKFFGDDALSDEAFKYVEENTILYTMCFNPSYCWIICSVLNSHFMTPEGERGAAPTTITELFVMFLHNILTKHKRQAEDQQGILIKLGKMAYYGVANRNLVFYDKFEMSTFGLQPVLPSPFLSGFLKEIPQRESTLEHLTYTFYHLTLQHFMAALSFLLDPSGGIEELLVKLDSCKDGRFEILTRFLAGLARPSVFKTLGGVLGEFERKKAKQILEWVKQKAEQALQDKDKSEALRVCQWLYETQNKKLIRDAIGKNLKMNVSDMTLSPLDCAVLGSVISCCGELEELNLSNTPLTSECIRRLAPGLICCRRVKVADERAAVSVSLYLCLHFLSLHLHSLTSSQLTIECCLALSSALSAEHSRLTELNLSYNKLGDSGVLELCKDLRDPNCKLEKLRISEMLTIINTQSHCLLFSLYLYSLESCLLTSECCSALSLALSAPHSQLTELQLNDNKLGDLGVDQLSEGLRSENCKLKTLRLSSCDLTSMCCSDLSCALSSPHSQLTELQLNYNKLEDSGVNLLCEGLRSENCKLKTLSLRSCHLASTCCSALSSAFSSPHSQLTELELNGNNLQDSGAAELCEGLRNINCKLKKLSLYLHSLSECRLASGCCSAILSALSAPHSPVAELELSYNELCDLGVTALCDGLKSENCKLEKLRLSSCSLTSRCCSALSSALSVPHSQLTELEMNEIYLEDSGVTELCEGLRSTNSKLEKLWIYSSKNSENVKRYLKSQQEELFRLGRQIDIFA
ncbi:NACHT, LRR and PYD domains-containing protein 3-like [Polypterus senegalus]|uniref:NACHT, LRR and PYD domains-containing protein 3-like n=1 Tax=Polypterus senegalus TaxID=55291 RepID=UPI0019625723|nr:NACHT, LRR and PYD domains-containing protein 3-like [Polypterus senegalus]